MLSPAGAALRDVWFQRTDLQMNMQGHSAEVTIWKASPAAGSCLPLPLGLVKCLTLFWPDTSLQLAPKNHQNSWRERKKKNQYCMALAVWERWRPWMCTHTHTHIHFSWKPVEVLCVIKSSWWRETWLNEWHSPGSHVSTTHDVVKIFFCCDRLSLPLFFLIYFCCRTCSCSGPQRSRTSFRIKFLRPSRLWWRPI